MPRYAAFLRGMNLGQRRIKNPELVAAFEALGLDDPEAFLASGNVAFSTRRSAAATPAKIERGLENELGYPVPTFVRTDSELRGVAEATPFSGRKGAPPRGKVQVAFLAAPPPLSARKALKSFESPREWLVLGRQELYWWPDAGISQSELDMKGLERLLGPFTLRTHNTVVRMVNQLFSD